MPKTEVILTHNVVGLGGESDQVKVAAGFARNYLFPQGLAIPLTGANRKRLESLKAKRAEREAKEVQSMTQLSQTLSKLTLVIAVKTGEDGKMFGSVTAGTIADELKSQYDASLDKRKIHLVAPIKTLGEHEVELRLHADLATTLKVRIDSLTPLPKPPEKAPEGKDQARGDGRRERGERSDRGEKTAEKPAAEKGASEKPERKSRAAK